MGVVERPRVTRDVPRRRPAGRVRTQRGYTTMANRRKFLAGLGALASGSAAAVGTGAFTSVSAERSAYVETASDNDALLAFDPSGSTNSTYVEGASSGAVSIDLSATDGDNLPNGNGTSPQGINTDAVTQINDLFSIRNQGTQAAVVYVPETSISAAGAGNSLGSFNIDPQATNRPNGDFKNSNATDDPSTGSPYVAGIGSDQISLTHIGTSSFPATTKYYGAGDDAIEEYVLEPGESFDFGLYLDTRSGDFDGQVNMSIVADSTVVPSSYAGDGS